MKHLTLEQMNQRTEHDFQRVLNMDEYRCSRCHLTVNGPDIVRTGPVELLVRLHQKRCRGR